MSVLQRKTCGSPCCLWCDSTVVIQGGTTQATPLEDSVKMAQMLLSKGVSVVTHEPQVRLAAVSRAMSHAVTMLVTDDDVRSADMQLQ